MTTAKRLLCTRNRPREDGSLLMCRRTASPYRIAGELDSWIQALCQECAAEVALKGWTVKLVELRGDRYVEVEAGSPSGLSNT